MSWMFNHYSSLTSLNSKDERISKMWKIYKILKIKTIIKKCNMKRKINKKKEKKVQY
jgi:hypothetical protein